MNFGIFKDKATKTVCKNEAELKNPDKKYHFLVIGWCYENPYISFSGFLHQPITFTGYKPIV